MTAVSFVERTGGVRVDLPSRPELLSVVRMLVHTLAQQRHLDDERVEDVVLAVSEAATSVMDSNPVTVAWSETEDAVTVEVSGGGAPSEDLSVPLIRALVDALTIDAVEGRTTMTLVVACDPWEEPV